NATPASRCAAASTSAAVGKAGLDDGCIERIVAPRPARPQGRSRGDFFARSVRRQGRRLARGALAHLVGPIHDLEPAVEMLDHGTAALHPVAAIDVADAEIVADRGVMDVAAD